MQLAQISSEASSVGGGASSASPDEEEEDASQSDQSMNLELEESGKVVPTLQSTAKIKMGKSKKKEKEKGKKNDPLKIMIRQLIQVFDDALKEVFDLLRADTFRRFGHTEAYEILVAKMKP